MKFLIINGPNMNLLGQREPAVYGTQDYSALCKFIADHAAACGDSVDFVQSNHEGVLIDTIQDAQGIYDGIVINPAAYTHYSYAMHDALKSITVPAVEVHISDLSTREIWRQTSVTAPACCLSIIGHGFAGYTEAMDYLRENRQ